MRLAGVRTKISPALAIGSDLMADEGTPIKLFHRLISMVLCGAKAIANLIAERVRRSLEFECARWSSYMRKFDNIRCDLISFQSRPAYSSYGGDEN